MLLPLCNVTCKCHVLAHEILSSLPSCNTTCKRAALAQQMAAAQTIFLWLCCRASTSGLPARLRSNSNARPLLHVCNTSKTAACVRHLRRSSINRQLQCKQRLWPTRLMSSAGRMHWLWSNVAESWSNGLRQQHSWRWPRSNVAESRRNALQHWWSHWPQNNIAKSWRIALQCRQRGLSPMSVVAGKRQNAAQCWGKRHWLTSNITLCWRRELQNQH